MNYSLRNRIIWLIFFSIAMGLLEAAVVIYLRDLYYPLGFAFPLTAMSDRNAIVELLREAATIIMLAGIGMLAGRTVNQRIAFFLGAFAIWDIFYYVFLKLMLDWPATLLTWDILFLIPVPWVGPVITPIIVSLTMILLAKELVHRDHQNSETRLSLKEWWLLISGSIVVIFSWTWEYIVYSLSAIDSLNALTTYVPQSYSWITFFIGEGLLLIAIYFFRMRAISTQ